VNVKPGGGTDAPGLGFGAVWRDALDSDCDCPPRRDRLARQNYQFEKRQRDLAKRKKQEEKRLRKQQRSQPQPSEPAAPESPPASPSGDEDKPTQA
jgi:hypothetical protein